MKEIKTVDAVGHVLCHDITQIIKDVSKGPVFRKGHVIREEDIPVLLSVGKDHIYVWENDETMMHENDAAEVLCEICKGENISRGEVKEGKIELRAECDGLFKIDEGKLEMVNSFGQMMIATRHGNFPVHKGDKLYIEGKIHSRSYDDRNGVKRYVTEIWADSMELLTPKATTPAAEKPAAPAADPVQAPF